MDFDIVYLILEKYFAKPITSLLFLIFSCFCDLLINLYANLLIAVLFMHLTASSYCRFLFKRQTVDIETGHKVKGTELSSCDSMLCGKFEEFTIADHENNTYDCHEKHFGVIIEARFNNSYSKRKNKKLCH